MAWDKYKVRQPVSTRQPSEKSLLTWCQKEVHVILGELRRVVNWAVDWLGLVQVVSGDTPGTLDSKLTVSGGLAKSVVTAVDGTSTLDISGSGIASDDHEVKADASDTGHGALDDKTEVGGIVTKTVVTTGGVKKVRLYVPAPSYPTVPSRYPGPMAATGVDFAGDKGQWADGNHSHPNISTLKGWLFSAFIPGQLWTACATWFGGYIRLNSPGGGWAESAPGSGVWNRTVVGSLTDSSIVSAFFDGVTPTLNMRVFNWYYGTGDTRNDGIYKVTDLGSASTYGQITRVTDADAPADFAIGKCVQVTGGNSAPNHVYRYNGPSSPTLDTDYLAFEDLGVVTPPAGDALAALTISQLTSEHASNETWEMAATFTSATHPNLNNADIGSSSFMTLVGTPGLLSIPAGDCVAQVQAKVSSTVTGDTSLRFTLWKFNPDDLFVELFHFDTGPIWSTSYVTLNATKPFTEQTLRVDDQLVFSINAYTTSATPVTVTAIINDAARSCRISLPIEFPVGTSEDHRTLTHREDKAQHPQSAVGGYIRVLAADYATADTDMHDVPGFEVDVEAGHIYKLDVHMPLTNGIGEGWDGGTYKFTVGGSASPTACMFVHEVGCSLSDGTPNQFVPTHSTVWGDAGVVAHSDGIDGLINVIVWHIRGIVRIDTAGTLKIRANTGTGGAVEVNIRVNSYMEVVDVS